MKNKQSNSILNTKTIKYYPKIKCSATDPDQVIYSTRVGTVKLVGCEVRKRKKNKDCITMLSNPRTPPGTRTRTGTRTRMRTRSRSRSRSGRIRKSRLGERKK